MEHNYVVGPQQVTCDSLMLDGVSQQLCINKIRTAKFRFNQTFKLTRKTGLQQGEYYSCGDSSGFLIIKFNDTLYLYSDVNNGIWDQFISSSDPEGFYLGTKDKLNEQL